MALTRRGAAQVVEPAFYDHHILDKFVDDAIMADLTAFGPPSDDISLVVIKLT